MADADLDTLQSVLEKSLVRLSNERYWMLETIREFARERLLGGTDGKGEAWVRFDSTEQRDTTMQYGVEEGAKAGFAQIDALLARLGARAG